MKGQKMTLLEEVFELAKQYGIKRSDIGRRIWGQKNIARVYILKNPTIKTLYIVKKAVDEMIAEKTIKKLEG